MSSELAPRPTTSGALGAVLDAGPGANISDLTFATKALHHTDLPDTFPTGTALTLATPHTPTASAPAASDAGAAPSHGTVLAHITRQAPKPLRLGDGTVVQRRTSQIVHPAAVVELVAERPLVKDGAVYKPAGGWALVRRRTSRWPSNATRTVGKAPLDPTPSPETSTASAAPQAGDERFREGADALAYLPAQVRRSLIARVPVPSVFDGKVVQYQDDHRYEVVVVRGDARTLIVATATRPENGAQWDVTMLTYDLSAATVQVEGRQ